MAKKKITVSAGVEVDEDRIAVLRAKFEQEPPASQSREKVWNEIQAMRQQALDRLHSELVAYENIGRHQINELFKI